MPIDIAELLFVEILKWPGYVSLATGNIIEDLIMLFFIPAALIIIFIWIILRGMQILEGSIKIQLLFGIIVFVFVIFSGYFGVFATLAKSYLIFIIFVYGLIYFALAHLRGHPKKSETTQSFPGATINQEEAIAGLPERIKRILGVPELNPIERKLLEKEIEKLDKIIEKLNKEAGKSQKADQALIHLSNLRLQRAALQEKLEGRL